MLPGLFLMRPVHHDTNGVPGIGKGSGRIGQQQERRMDYARHVWEGWTVKDFIDVLSPQIEMIMTGKSWHRPFRTREELALWCRDSQPYYKKDVPEVVCFFAKKYGL